MHSAVRRMYMYIESESAVDCNERLNERRIILVVLKA